ncbi:hypothetical protein FGO68_gene16207 [Halteria grandinella]|uniref:Protein artemis n=1 Tax=Halteria grandinella TaxID=5974 RepID=A0A8J8T4P0_HALGN|nr:hypothetical protein FGO68_gene16207 [Halteria grandinella]
MFMDACHCPGAVMILFRGKFGTILHTGDFRFSPSMFDNDILFPPEKRNKEMHQMSLPVDYLFLDNTFADRTYDFPSRDEAYANVKSIVESHKSFRIFVFAYLLGKEEVFINLAKDFETLIVVDEERYKKLQLMDLEPELFTTDTTKGWIHVKPIKSLKWLSLEEVNKTEEPTVFIILTGWNDKYNSNLPFYFKAPYSSHSNYREIERLVKAICPKNIVFTVPDRENSRKRLEFQHYLIEEYCLKPHRSEEEIRQLQVDDQRGFVTNRKQNFAGQFKPQMEEELEESKKGYQGCGEVSLAERFNVNNKELNKQRFMETNAHVFKTKVGNKRLTGAKFVAQELSFELSPLKEDELLPQVPKSAFELKGIPIGSDLPIGTEHAGVSKLILKPAEKELLQQQKKTVQILDDIGELIEIDEDDIIIDEDEVGELMRYQSESENSNCMNVAQQEVQKQAVEQRAIQQIGQPQKRVKYNEDEVKAPVVVKVNQKAMMEQLREKFQKNKEAQK